MWKKSWWECRFRVALAAGIIAAYVLGGVLLMADPGKGGFSWENYCQVMAGIVISVVALLFAGSGVNSQSQWGMTQGFHPSMYFLLSLPISRRRTLAVRATVGAILTVLSTVVAVVGGGIAANLIGIKIPAAHIVGSTVFMTVGALGLFGFETLLSTVLDEMWAGVIGFTLVGGLFGAGWVTHDMGKSFRPLEFVTGSLWNRHGDIGWAMLALFLGMGFLCIAASVVVVERKEY